MRISAYLMIAGLAGVAALSKDWFYMAMIGVFALIASADAIATSIKERK